MATDLRRRHTTKEFICVGDWRKAVGTEPTRAAPGAVSLEDFQHAPVSNIFKIAEFVKYVLGAVMHVDLDAGRVEIIEGKSLVEGPLHQNGMQMFEMHICLEDCH